MKKISSMLCVILAIILMFAGCSTSPTPSDTPNNMSGTPGQTADSSQETEIDPSQITIALILKSMSNSVFVTVEQGAKKAAAELGVTLTSQASDSETDIEQQIQILENAISSGVDAIVITLNDASALASTIKKANDAGIPVITLNQQADATSLEAVGAHVETYAGADDYYSQKILAEALCESIEKKGKVAIIEGIAGNEVAETRHQAATDVIDACPNIELVSSQPADWETEKAYSVAQNIIEANPDLVGIIACNDTMAVGAVQAVLASGKDIKVTGMDAIDEALELVEKGTLYATLTQHFDSMGYMGVMYAWDAICGKALDAEYTIEAELITSENIKNFR